MGTESQQRHPPSVDMTDMMRRKRLEAELFAVDGQIRSFDRVRDRLIASDQDATTFYRQLVGRRTGLSKNLKEATLGKSVGRPTPQFALPEFGQSLVTRQIAPARFNWGLGVFGFGTSGYVQVAPAEDCVNVVPQGRYPVSGQINDVPGGYPGTVLFDGNLGVGPDEIALSHESENGVTIHASSSLSKCRHLSMSAAFESKAIVLSV